MQGKLVNECLSLSSLHLCLSACHIQTLADIHRHTRTHIYSLQPLHQKAELG